MSAGAGPGSALPAHQEPATGEGSPEAGQALRDAARASWDELWRTGRIVPSLDGLTPAQITKLARGERI